MCRSLALTLIPVVLLAAVVCGPHVWAEDLLANWHMSDYDKVHSLLADTSTVEKLALTTNQQAFLHEVYSIQWDAIPAVRELLDRSKSVDWSTRHSLLAEAERQASQYKLKQIAAILSPEQWQVIQRHMLQEKGLSVVLQSNDVRAQLDITDDQLEEMRQFASKYAPLLEGLDQRHGRQQVAGLRPGEDMSGREHEVECIEHVIDALRADQNRDLRGILTDLQRNRWDQLVGIGSP